MCRNPQFRRHWLGRWRWKDAPLSWKLAWSTGQSPDEDAGVWTARPGSESAAGPSPCRVALAARRPVQAQRRRDLVTEGEALCQCRCESGRVTGPWILMKINKETIRRRGERELAQGLRRALGWRPLQSERLRTSGPKGRALVCAPAVRWPQLLLLLQQDLPPHLFRCVLKPNLISFGSKMFDEARFLPRFSPS